MKPDKTKRHGLADISEEFRAHRRRFLLVVIFCGVACATIFLQSHRFGLIPLALPQIIATSLYILAALMIAILLWRHPGLYGVAVWSYDLATIGLFLSVLISMPQDELRAIWFFLLIAGAFTMIGTIAGWANVVAAFLAVTVTDAAGLIHYSGNATATFTICLVASGVFFHTANWQIASFVDRTVRATRSLEADSRTDALTGLANNRALADAWEELSLAPHPIGFLFVDVDHFKAINDSFGHDGGDLVLKTIADTLRASAGNDAVTGRIGGEEFAILLPDTSVERAIALAERIRLSVEDLRPKIGDKSIDITTSVGVAVSQAPHPAQGLVKRAADVALYRAKQLGRNRVVAAEAELPA